MQPEERDPAYLWDMREAAREALQFVDGLDYAGFLANRQVWLAVERELQIVGEAARRVSAAYKAAHPEVPWHAIVGQRNVLVHEYGDIDSRRFGKLPRGNLQSSYRNSTRSCRRSLMEEKRHD
jgi:uncharacterized protein with HEPN domain